MIYPNDIVYNESMKWIYLSPHFDDVAYSCGGLIWEQIRSGLEVEVWTICAGLPPAGEHSEFVQELHTRWGLDVEEAVTHRRDEDMEAMRILGVRRRLFSVPDAVYRRHPKTNEPLYSSWVDVIGGLHPGDEATLRLLTLDLAAAWPGIRTSCACVLFFAAIRKEFAAPPDLDGNFDRADSGTASWDSRPI